MPSCGSVSPYGVKLAVNDGHCKNKQATHSQKLDKCRLPSTIRAYDADPTAPEVPSLEPPQRYVNVTKVPHLDNDNAQLTL